MGSLCIVLCRFHMNVKMLHAPHTHTHDKLLISQYKNVFINC